MSSETFGPPPLPLPGDIVVAQVAMRAWEDDAHRGSEGLYVERGTQMLVLQVTTVDGTGNRGLVKPWYPEPNGRVRIRGLVNGTIALFSHDAGNFHINWVPIGRLTGPTGTVDKSG